MNKHDITNFKNKLYTCSMWCKYHEVTLTTLVFLFVVFSAIIYAIV